MFVSPLSMHHPARTNQILLQVPFGRIISPPPVWSQIKSLEHFALLISYIRLPGRMASIHSQVRTCVNFSSETGPLHPCCWMGDVHLPVMKLLASLIRKAAAPLYSRGWLNRPSIFCFGHSVFLSGYVTKRSSTIAVII